jgi:DNA-binding NarL/FixJ family response regulator
VLVGVRTAAVAQTVAAFAERLGLTSTVRTAVSAAEAATRLREQPAEVVLLDTALTRPDSAGVVRRLLALSPGSTVVLFGAEDSHTATAALTAGARGVIRAGDDLVSAVAKGLLLLMMPGPAAAPAAHPGAPATLAGQTQSPGGPLARSATLVEHDPVVPAQRGDAPPAPVLTERELQVLRGMADGHSNAEIGRELFVSEDTVKTHARRLFRKLGARDRAHAVAAGFRAGLVS